MRYDITIIDRRRLSDFCGRRYERRDSLNKKEFIDYTSVLTGVPRYRLRDALEAFIDSTESALEEGKSVRIAGLGEMTVKQRMPSKGRDPRNGEVIEIPAKK
jgi:nucleoid DNA-binding protein